MTVPLPQVFSFIGTTSYFEPVFFRQFFTESMWRYWNSGMTNEPGLSGASYASVHFSGSMTLVLSPSLKPAAVEAS